MNYEELRPHPPDSHGRKSPNKSDYFESRNGFCNPASAKATAKNLQGPAVQRHSNTASDSEKDSRQGDGPVRKGN